MPKPSKTRPKPKVKPKRKVEAETPGLTTKRSYWISLAVVMAVASAVVGFTSGIGVAETAILMVAILVPISVLGYIRINPSNLPISKRATFVFAGISVIGFGIWAAIVMVGGAYGLLVQIQKVMDSQFFIVTSLAICLSAGAFIGELIGKNKEVQVRLFPELSIKEQ